MIQIETSVAVTLFLAFSGLLFGFGKVLLTLYDKRLAERMDAQDKLRQQQMSTLHNDINGVSSQIVAERVRINALQGQVNDIALKLPLEYFRREDQIRFSMTIDRKLDLLFEAITNQRSTH